MKPARAAMRRSALLAGFINDTNRASTLAEDSPFMRAVKVMVETSPVATKIAEPSRAAVTRFRLDCDALAHPLSAGMFRRRSPRRDRHTAGCTRRRRPG